MTDTTHNRPKVLAITLQGALAQIRRELHDEHRLCCVRGEVVDAALEQIDNVLDELEAMARE